MYLMFFRELKWLDLAYYKCLVKLEGHVCKKLLDVKEMYYGRRKGFHGRQHGKKMKVMGRQLG